MDITQTALRGDLFHPIWDMRYVGQYAILAGGGLIVRRRGYPKQRSTTRVKPRRGNDCRS